MSLWTIPFTRAFLPALVEGLDQLFGDRLEDALILLPSRRATLALRDELRPKIDGVRLCPRIQPIGEVEEDALLLSAAEALELPPSIDPIRRRLLLARLVRAVEATSGRPVNVDRSVRLAGDLAGFLDELQTEEIDPFDLDRLVPGELAEHWQRTLSFLKIVDTTWPAVLREEGRVDAPMRRRLLLDARAASWRRRPPGFPIIVAGVTGTIPAVARLMEVVAQLPQGHLVLHGLNPDGPAKAEPTQPVAPLLTLLERLGSCPKRVRPWPAAGEPTEREALDRRLGEVAGQDAVALSSGSIRGLSLETWRDPASAAVSAALHLREAVERPDRTAALVTNDRTLARRVAIELARYGIVVDDSAGTPLDQTPPGSLMLLAAHASVESFAPPGLLALLKHPMVQGGLRKGQFRRFARALEGSVLRGPRPAGGLDGLLSLLRDRDARLSGPIAAADLASWFNEFVSAAAPLAALLGGHEAVRPAELLFEQVRFVRWLASDEAGDDTDFFAREAGAEIANFLPRLEGALVDEAPMPPSAWPALLAVLMAEIPVRPRRPRHPRIAIRGRYEARLLTADRIVVAGLDEGVWPEHADAGPWLNRSMRQALGLPSPDAKVGVAGHDLLSQFSADEIVLIRSRRDQSGGPSKPSRFLVRLESALRGAGLLELVEAGHARTHLVERLDAANPAMRRIDRPRPRPPRSARPTEIWATEIHKLLGDPYLFYTQKILKLRELDPIDAQAGAAERGIAIHRALEGFVRAFPAALPNSPLAELLRHGSTAFAQFQHYPQVGALWWPRFLLAAQRIIEAEIERRPNLLSVLVEQVGTWSVLIGERQIELKAKADRLEELTDGRVAVIDYKTGRLPSVEDLVALRQPQILVEGLIARNGRFGRLERAEVGLLALWAMSGRGSVDTQVDSELDAHLDRLEQGIVRLLEWYDHPDHPFTAVAKTAVARRLDGFDHLSRVAEWTADPERVELGG